MLEKRDNANLNSPQAIPKQRRLSPRQASPLRNRCMCHRLGVAGQIDSLWIDWMDNNTVGPWVHGDNDNDENDDENDDHLY